MLCIVQKVIQCSLMQEGDEYAMVTIINVELSLDNGAKIQPSHTIRAKNATMMSVANVLHLLLNCRIERKRSKEKAKLARMRRQRLLKDFSMDRIGLY